MNNKRYIFVALIGILLYYYFQTKVGQNGFGRSSTSEEVTEGLNLHGRVYIVTGANTGIGYDTARVLALRGGKVVLHARKIEKAKEAIEKARAEHPGVELDLVGLEMDLGSLESIRKFVDSFFKLDLPLNGLILNAASLAPLEYQKTLDGFELQMGVNYIGHFYLTKLLLEKLEKSAPSRVVVVSSDAYRMSNSSFISSPNLELDYELLATYGNSKFAQIMFSKELNDRYHSKGINSFSLHPGVIATNLHVTSMNDIFGSASGVVMFFLGLIRKSTTQGAATSVYCATAPEIENLGGYFFDDVNVVSTSLEDVVQNKTLTKMLWEKTERMIAEKLNKN